MNSRTQGKAYSSSLGWFHPDAQGWFSNHKIKKTSDKGLVPKYKNDFKK